MKNFSSKYLTAFFMIFAIASFAIVSSNPANAGKRRVEVGVLTCLIKPGSNFIIGSTKHLRCKLVGKSGKLLARYRGEINRFGIDLGEAKRSVMKWAVIAPTRGFRSASLHGSYVGVAADASLGIGAGAKVLVGGSRKTITLQPISVQGQRGVNLALTVAEMKLRAF